MNVPFAVMNVPFAQLCPMSRNLQGSRSATNYRDQHPNTQQYHDDRACKYYQHREDSPRGLLLYNRLADGTRAAAALGSRQLVVIQLAFAFLLGERLGGIQVAKTGVVLDRGFLPVRLPTGND